MRRIGELWSKLAFLEPGYLILFWIVVGLAILFAFALTLRFFRTPSRTRGSRYPRIPKAKFWIFVLAAASLMTLSLARPYMKGAQAGVLHGNVDVIVAIDNSISTRATDLGKQRVEVAKDEALRLTSGILSKGDRAALFVFGRNSLRKLHLSGDFSRFNDEVQRVGFPAKLVGDALIWDTDFALTLEHIYQSLDSQDAFMKKRGLTASAKTKRRRLVFFISDGDDRVRNEQKLNVDMIEFRKRGIRIYSIGIGTRAGVPLLSVLKGYKKSEDYDGSLEDEWRGHYTRLETKTLATMADKTGGRLFTIEHKGVNSHDFMKNAVDSEKSVVLDTMNNDLEVHQELWWFVLCGVVFVLLLAIIFY